MDFKSELKKYQDIVNFELQKYINNNSFKFKFKMCFCCCKLIHKCLKVTSKNILADVVPDKPNRRKLV